MFERRAPRVRRGSQRAHWLVATASLPWLCVAAQGCDAEPKPEPVGLQRLEIAPGKVTLGFATGTLRGEVELPGFAIARHPVTRAQYTACVDADGCAEAECTTTPGPFEGAEELPVDCVSFAQASRFCAWVGGSLPRLDQWMRAARGPSPRRFAWGDEKATCERHPFAGLALSALSGASDARFGRGVTRCGVAPSEYTVGQHPESRFEDGMQDALLTPSELVRGTGASPFGACSSDGAGCVVYGLEAGAIDGVSEVSPTATPSFGVGFRCAWEK